MGARKIRQTTYKAIIFDFFGVIHRDPFQHWLKSRSLERSGKLHELSRKLDSGDISNEEFYDGLSRLSGHPAHTIRDIYDDINFIDDDMVALIKTIKTGYKTGLLSNSSIEYLSRIVDRHKLESLFDVITVSAEVGLIKPDPKIFKHVLQRLGVNPEEAIFIDDNPNNTAAAAKLGLKAIVYTDIDILKRELRDTGITI